MEEKGQFKENRSDRRMGKASVCTADDAKEWKTRGSVRGTKPEQKERRRTESSNKQIRNAKKSVGEKRTRACKYGRKRKKQESGLTMKKEKKGIRRMRQKKGGTIKTE